MRTIFNSIKRTFSGMLSSTEMEDWELLQSHIHVEVVRMGIGNNPQKYQFFNHFPIPLCRMSVSEFNFYLNTYFIPRSDANVLYYNPIDDAWVNLESSGDWILNVVQTGCVKHRFKVIEIPVAPNYINSIPADSLNDYLNMLESKFEQRLTIYVRMSEKDREIPSAGIRLLLWASKNQYIPKPSNMIHMDFIIL